MFRCERCGAGYNATVATFSDTCPRCKAHGVEARLRFRLFEPAAQSEAAGSQEASPLEASPSATRERDANAS